MTRVRLIHWNASEARERAKLIGADYAVAFEMPAGPDVLRELRKNPPAAFVIDLSRLPMQGRDVALAVRQYKSTRHVPIVFVDGDAEKVAKVKQLVPDAVYTTWGRIRSGLKRAIANPPSQPAVPESLLAGYSGTPLPKKLGIKANSIVTLIDAPEDFLDTLGHLPDGARISNQARGRCDVMIWFIRSRKELLSRVGRIATLADFRALWIAWPKKASGVTTDLAEQMVRETGLAEGLVDYKICAIDPIWSGLCFSRRKPSKS